MRRDEGGHPDKRDGFEAREQRGGRGRGATLILLLLLLLRVRGKEVRECAVEHERPGRRGEDVIRDEIRLDQRPGAAGAGASTTSTTTTTTTTTTFCIGFRELQLELCDVRRKNKLADGFTFFHLLRLFGREGASVCA